MFNSKLKEDHQKLEKKVKLLEEKIESLEGLLELKNKPSYWGCFSGYQSELIEKVKSLLSYLEAEYTPYSLYSRTVKFPFLNSLLDHLKLEWKSGSTVKGHFVKKKPNPKK